MMNKQKKEIKVEWCENWIRSIFAKHPFPGGGFELNLFWDKAEKSGLWERGTYGSPMSQALSKLCKIEAVHNDNGEFLYNVIKLA